MREKNSLTIFLFDEQEFIDYNTYITVPRMFLK